MDKNIKELLRKLKIEFWTVWIITLLIFLAGETEVIANGLYVGSGQTEFMLGIVCIMLTLIGVPLSLNLFTLNTTKGLRRLNLDEALSSYHIWSIIRMAMLLVCIVFNVAAYYLTLDVKALLCALIPLVVTLYCWPTKEKIDRHLESCNNTME